MAQLYVDGDGCQLPGFGDINRKRAALATIFESGHMARFIVEKNKLFTIRLVFSQGAALGYGTYSACEIVYSFVPTSDRYTIAGGMSEDKKTCFTQVKSSSGDEPVAVKRILIAGRYFNPPYCPPMLVEDRQKLGLPVP